MKRTLFLFFFGLLLLAFAPQKTLAFSFNPNYILSDFDLTDSLSLSLTQIEHFLNRGALGSYTAPDADGVERSAAEIVWRTSQNVGISPKFLLVLLQKEQSLVQDKNPSQSQLDWATGYGVCDSCAKSDDGIARWKGFGKQVNSAALQFVDGYMQDIRARGVTQGKYGPGIEVAIDGQTVTPANAATAAMYAYTPHIQGNENFAKIWDRWFGLTHPTGTLLKSATSPDIYFIEYGLKRHIKSWSAFVSRFNKNLIIEVPQSAIDNYADGRAIDLPNFALLEDEVGTRYLLVNDALRKFDSNETFAKIGFVEDELMPITTAEALQYEFGEPITLKTTAPQGNLLQLRATGGVFYIQDGKRHPIIDKAILIARFPNAPIRPVDEEEIMKYDLAEEVTLPDGYLVKWIEDPTVYIISEGMRRAIASEAVFNSYGWQWSNIIDVPERVINLHLLGDPIVDAI